MSNHIYLVHGYTANIHSHWFDWLAQYCAQRSLPFTPIAMPDTHSPKVVPWVQTLQDTIISDRCNILIGHSLGCISLLRYLAGCQQTIAGMILVAGFAQPLPSLPELDPFMADSLPYSQLIGQIEQRVVLASVDDPVVPYTHSQWLAEQLDAQYLQLDGYGHFLAKTGITSLPPLAARLEHLLVKV